MHRRRHELFALRLFDNLDALRDAADAVILHGDVPNSERAGAFLALERGNQILDDGGALVVKGLAGAELLDVVVVLGRARRDDLVPRRDGELDPIAADAACAAPHEERLTRRLRGNGGVLQTEVVFLEKTARGRRQAQGKDRGVFVRQGSRYGRSQVLEDVAVGLEGAKGVGFAQRKGHAGDPVADLEAGDGTSDFDYFAREVGAEDGGIAAPGKEFGALYYEIPVDWVDGHGLVLDDDLVVVWGGVGRLFDLYDTFALQPSCCIGGHDGLGERVENLEKIQE